ncbi:hypothetical protein D1007_55114 [Hordeum vulgare]|nr:hypothetical protein D1007_55114 [Hordeum vulgare]
MSSKSENDSSLFIEKVAHEHVMMGGNPDNWLVTMDKAQAAVMDKNPKDDMHVKSQAYKSSSKTYAQVVSNSGQVQEMEGNVDPKLKVDNNYVVQFPPLECAEDIIPTPPLAPETTLRFIQHNNMERADHMETKAMNLAKKRNMEGTSQNHFTSSFSTLSNPELMSKASKMGVIIPDDDFTHIDVLIEMENVWRNMYDKNKNNDIDSDPDDLIIVNGLGLQVECDAKGMRSIAEAIQAGTISLMRLCNSSRE